MTTKVIPNDMKEMQFVAEEFNSVTDFDAFLQGVIDEQEALLLDRVGASVFATASLAVHIKRAEKCLVAAELLQRRIVRLSGNIDSESVAIISALKKSRHDYLEESAAIMPRLLSGTLADGSDIMFGQNTSSHFDGASA